MWFICVFASSIRSFFHSSIHSIQFIYTVSIHLRCWDVYLPKVHIHIVHPSFIPFIPLIHLHSVHSLCSKCYLFCLDLLFSFPHHAKSSLFLLASFSSVHKLFLFFLFFFSCSLISLTGTRISWWWDFITK